MALKGLPEEYRSRYGSDSKHITAVDAGRNKLTTSEVEYRLAVMTNERYPQEELDQDYDDGTMPENVAELEKAVVGRRIVRADIKEAKRHNRYWSSGTGLVLTLDDGTEVALLDTSDCCAYTALESFFIDPSAVDHVIMGVGTTDGYTTWHIYADWGDIMKLEVGWSSGNPFYYGYGFDIQVVKLEEEEG